MMEQLALAGQRDSFPAQTLLICLENHFAPDDSALPAFLHNAALCVR